MSEGSMQPLRIAYDKRKCYVFAGNFSGVENMAYLGLCEVEFSNTAFWSHDYPGRVSGGRFLRIKPETEGGEEVVRAIWCIDDDEAWAGAHSVLGTRISAAVALVPKGIPRRSWYDNILWIEHVVHLKSDRKLFELGILDVPDDPNHGVTLGTGRMKERGWELPLDLIANK